MRAINAYRNGHGLVPMVVCSRTDELETLGARLRLEEAVELQLLTDAQVEIYLDRLEAAGTPVADVRVAMGTDEGLRELLRSPLLLHVLSINYHGQPVPALPRSGTLVERQAPLWQGYVTRMFKQRPLDPRFGYTDRQALGWLSWLARTLRDRDESEFHLDRLTPNWLPAPARLWRLRRVAAIASVVVISLLVVIAVQRVLVWSAADDETRPTQAGQEWISAIVPPAAWLAGLLCSFGLIARLTGGIEQVEELHWSWSGLVRRMPRRLAWGLVWGLSLGVIFGAFRTLALMVSNSHGTISTTLPGGSGPRDSP